MSEEVESPVDGGGGGVVALEHEGVHLLADVLVGELGAVLRVLQQEVQERQALLLAF